MIIKTQEELYNEYIVLYSRMKEDRSLLENDEFLDKCDSVWYAMDKETMDLIDKFLAERKK